MVVDFVSTSTLLWVSSIFNILLIANLIKRNIQLKEYKDLSIGISERIDQYNKFIIDSLDEIEFFDQKVLSRLVVTPLNYIKGTASLPIKRDVTGLKEYILNYKNDLL
jgi:hypothetical protein